MMNFREFATFVTYELFLEFKDSSLHNPTINTVKYRQTYIEAIKFKCSVKLERKSM